MKNGQRKKQKVKGGKKVEQTAAAFKEEDASILESMQNDKGDHFGIN